MILDGEEVLVGDAVYDIARAQTGTVSEVDGAGCHVSFGAVRSRYSNGGLFVGVRRLYWRDPILALPRKNDQDWGWLADIVARLVLKIRG